MQARLEFSDHFGYIFGTFAKLIWFGTFGVCKIKIYLSISYIRITYQVVQAFKTSGILSHSQTKQSGQFTSYRPQIRRTEPTRPRCSCRSGAGCANTFQLEGRYQTPVEKQQNLKTCNKHLNSQKYY